MTAESATGRCVMVVGSGGREHALALRLLASPSVSEVVVVPGNAGTTEAGGAPEGLRSLAGDPLAVARELAPDLVVVGPEAPLTAGLVDRLTEAGLLSYGPTAAAARLEGSKAFMKEFCERHGIRTARWVRADTVEAAERAIATFEVAPVVKADGLCAGKGVVVAETHAEARAAARAMLEDRVFGAAGASVVIEERLVGDEASVHAICDGERAVVLPAAQDHKRIGDGDQGPNTGGMGTYAPAPVVTGELGRRIEAEVIGRVLAGMRADGVPFRGTLFAGLMITPSGEPVVLEFNVRFGDPETQVLMPLLEGDLADTLMAAARGELAPGGLVVGPQSAVCVVAAAPGYPGTPRTGDRIEGLAAAARHPGVHVVHAGTALSDGAVVTSGGRVLGVTAVGPSLQIARDRAYAALADVTFDGMQARRDIGHRALGPRG